MASKAPAEAERTPALVVSGVSHSFGDRQVLDNVSLTVEQGAFVVLLGLNGAGKSTLFSLITRLYDNVSGQIAIRGFDVRRKPSEALQRLGVVFQSRTLDIDLTLMQNLRYHAALHGFAGRAAAESARQALELVGLADRANEKIRALSGGQLRRVEIARSMMHHPDLLLLDEATVGLDLGSRESVIKIVRDLVAHEGVGVLWATHLMDEVLPTDRVVVLHKGKVLYDGPVPQLLTQTGTTSVREAFRNLTGTKTTIDEAA
ncbi:ABC transporter ATP-binding protein [Hyphomicrobium sp.]|uniref:ABC transporter ATP-binding protein n=1 Tax=Hyphomicrobium sp. TaxID=82 RepID=UPI002D78C7A5|nr:ABC transporter ATP-binding protein [Hyphomicrobium sp.]HET6387882.1 ABC transporter ATP-binding protein [Hyphomicrobium sp.]